MSWIGGRHYYWLDEAKTKLMCDGYRVPDEYIPEVKRRIGQIDTWDPRLKTDRDYEREHNRDGS